MTVTYEFCIKLESNQYVYMFGYVNRNDILGDDCDWYFDKIEHDEEKIQGLTNYQLKEIEELITNYQENYDEIGDIILQCDLEDTHEDNYYSTNRYGLIIEVYEINTDCKFDSHDFLCNSCEKCNKCGFIY